MLWEYATVPQAPITHIAHQQCSRCTTQDNASPFKMMEACKHTQLQNRRHVQILFDAIVAVITASIINRQKYNLNSNLHSAYRITLVYTSLLSRNDEKRSNGSHFKGKHQQFLCFSHNSLKTITNCRVNTIPTTDSNSTCWITLGCIILVKNGNMNIIERTRNEQNPSAHTVKIPILSVYQNQTPKH